MNLPGFAAEGSLYISPGQYQSVADRAILAGQVSPAGVCCSDCNQRCNCFKVGSFDPEYNQCISICAAERQVCLSNCVDCRTQPTPCCPSGCRGTC